MSALLPPSGIPESSTSNDEPQPVSAAQRLAESRERMRQWMLRTDGRSEARRRAAAAKAEGAEPSWLDRLRGHAVVGTVVDAVSSWWSNHPLRPAASLATSLVRDAIAPLARRHPVGIVAGAFAFGGALAWFRPWGWLIKPALFAGLASQIVTRFIAQVPIESLLNAFSTLTEPRASEKHDVAEDHAAAAPMPVSMPTEERPTVH